MQTFAAKLCAPPTFSLTRQITRYLEESIIDHLICSKFDFHFEDFQNLLCHIYSESYSKSLIIFQSNCWDQFKAYLLLFTPMHIVYVLFNLDRPSPTLVKILRSQFVRYICCGEEHTAVLTKVKNPSPFSKPTLFAWSINVWYLYKRSLVLLLLLLMPDCMLT